VGQALGLSVTRALRGPPVSNPAWIKQLLDAFILQQLDARKIQPAPDELPQRWLRRVTLDLTGLPPTLAELAAFLLSVPLVTKDYAAMTKLTREIAELTRSVWQLRWNSVSKTELWNPLRILRAKSKNDAKLAIQSRENWDEYHTVGTISSNTTVQVTLPLPKSISPVSVSQRSHSIRSKR